MSCLIRMDYRYSNMRQLTVIAGHDVYIFIQVLPSVNGLLPFDFFIWQHSQNIILHSEFCILHLIGAVKGVSLSLRQS